MKNNNYFFNFILIVLSYLVSSYIITLFFSDYISIRELSLLQIPFFLLPAIYLSKHNNISNKINFRLDIKSILGILWGMAGLSLFFYGWEVLQNSVSQNFLSDFLSGLREESEQLQYQLAYNNHNTIFEYIKIILFVSIVPAICEEFLFRGYLLQSIISKNENKKIKSVLLSAFLFSFVHFNFISMVPIFIMGIYLAMLAISTENLLIPIVFHATNNLITIISINYNHLSEIKIIENTYIGVILFFIGLLVMYFSYKTTTSKKYLYNNKL